MIETPTFVASVFAGYGIWTLKQALLHPRKARRNKVAVAVGWAGCMLAGLLFDWSLAGAAWGMAAGGAMPFAERFVEQRLLAPTRKVSDATCTKCGFDGEECSCA
jgi:hypothetical protein